MKLYIANCSRQPHTFNYKLPEKTQSFGVTIPSGRQHMIENQSDIIDHIIRQHEPYGFQRCDKVDKNFSGICYSIDKPVSVGRIEDCAEQKTENLESMSEEILAASAVSLNNAVDQAVILAKNLNQVVLKWKSPGKRLTPNRKIRPAQSEILRLKNNDPASVTGGVYSLCS